MQFAQTMQVSLKKVAICSDKNSRNWLGVCVFQLEYLQLAMSMHILVEVVVVGSDYECFN